jgi:translocator protein
VWTALYAMIGISLGLLLKGRHQPTTRSTLTVFSLQLVLNFAWSPLFFGAHQTGLALIDIVAMWLSIIGTIFLAKRINSTSAYLLIPYLGWTSYATYLNAGFWWLNR